MSITIHPVSKTLQLPLGETNIVAFPCSIVRHEINGSDVRTKSLNSVDHNIPTEETVVSSEFAPTKYQYLVRLHCRQSGKLVVNEGQADVYYQLKLNVPRGYMGTHKEGHLEFVRMPTEDTPGLARSVITQQTKEFSRPSNLGPIENLLYASLQRIYATPPEWCKPKLTKLPTEIADTVKRMKADGWPTKLASHMWYMTLANQVAQHLLGLYRSPVTTIEKLTEAGLLNGSIPLVGPYPSCRLYDTSRDVSYLGLYVHGGNKHNTKNLQLLNVLKQKLGITVTLQEFQDALKEAQRQALDPIYVGIHSNDSNLDNLCLYPLGVVTTKQL